MVPRQVDWNAKVPIAGHGALTPHYLTSPHLSSYATSGLTSPHIASPRLTSSPLITSSPRHPTDTAHANASMLHIWPWRPGRFWGNVISVFGRLGDHARRYRGLRHQGATVQGALGYRGATSASSGALLEVLKKCPNMAQKGDCQYGPPRGPLNDAPTRPPPPLTEGRRHRVLLWAGRARLGGHMFPKPCDHGVLRRPS